MSVPSANPTYKLYYFNIKGLAEPIRFLFAYGGLKYEDVRVSKEDWPALKPSIPLGQLPVLEVDGHKAFQSLSIARYVAKQVGLAGKNDWENLQIDSAVDTITDFRLKLTAVFFETDEELKKKKFDTLMNETVPFYLEKLDAIAKENNGYFALGRITWVDLYFTALIETFKLITKPDLLDNYPNVQAVVDNVLAVESIKEWVRTRPQTDR